MPVKYKRSKAVEAIYEDISRYLNAMQLAGKSQASYIYLQSNTNYYLLMKTSAEKV